MRSGHSALSASFYAACTSRNNPAWPCYAQVCPVKRRHLILGILFHLRQNAHSCLVVPLAQAPLLSQLPFQLVDVLAPLITEPLPLLPLQRTPYVTSQRHAARACPVIGMSCLYNAFCLFREQSLLSGCCNIFVKVINKAVSRAAKRLLPGSVQDISRCLNLTPLSDSLKVLTTTILPVQSNL
jgi:hypothetical protein